jgi:hypothetical protein
MLPSDSLESRNQCRLCSGLAAGQSCRRGSHQCSDGERLLRGRSVFPWTRFHCIAGSIWRDLGAKHTTRGCASATSGRGDFTQQRGNSLDLWCVGRGVASGDFLNSNGPYSGCFPIKRRSGSIADRVRRGRIGSGSCDNARACRAWRDSLPMVTDCSVRREGCPSICDARYSRPSRRD